MTGYETFLRVALCNFSLLTGNHVKKVLSQIFIKYNTALIDAL